MYVPVARVATMLCEGHCPKFIISMSGACSFYRETDVYRLVETREELSTVCVLTEIRASGALKARSYRCYCRVTDGFGHPIVGLSHE